MFETGLRALDISGCETSISEKIALKFTRINSSGPWFSMSATKKYWLNFTLCKNRKPVQWPHYEGGPAALRWKRAKATSTAGRDTSQRARLSNTKIEITCLMFWRLLLEVICCGKFFLNLTEQMFIVLFFIAFCLTLRGHKAGLFHAHWFPVVFCSQQDLTSADAVLAFPFTSLKPALWAFCYTVNKSFSFFSFLKLSTGFLT